MPAGVCSVVKSKPRQVRRSISDTSLDVHGAVTVEKVWIGEGDVLPSDQLQDGTDALCLGQRKRHVWSLYTNLACTQQCLKCEKRILTRRAAYKCTVCKKLCHLKCAIKERSGIASRTRSQVRYDGQKWAVHTPKHIDQNHFVNTNRKKQAVSEVPVCETTERNPDKRSIGELDSLDEFIMQEDICKEDSPTKEKDHNIIVQGQAKQSFSNLKTNFVRRCRSFKKKVEKLKDKLNCDDCSKKEENDFGIDVDQETVTAEQDAWMCSPVRKRLKTRLRRGNHILTDNGDDVLEYKRKSCERKCHTYGLQLSHMNDRLDAVEKKLAELEQSVPREVDEWRKLHKKAQNNDYTSNQADIMELAVDDTVPKMVLHEERLPSSSSAATSDDIYRLPESTISSGNKDDYQSLPDKGDRDQTSPSTVLPRLQTDLPSEIFTDQQTSTPVTHREISFLSATNQYRLSQITHKNITHFNLDTSGTELPQVCKDNMESEQNENENRKSSPRHQALKSFLEKRKSLPESRKRNSETEEESSKENNILSPNQLAVQKFLERRRSNPLSEVKENPQFANSPRLCSAEETAGVHKSPHIISSTFSNGNGDHEPQFNVSPISFTLRNDLEASAISFTKILEESKNNERKQSGLGKSAFNMSALSYTFRNDSSMIHTNASEHIPGFSDNLPRIRQENDNVQINSPRLQFEMFQNRANTDAMERPTDNTTDGLSLTNVTEFTTEHQNSLTENKFVSPWSQISQVGHISRESKPLSDEILVQVKCGVKLKNRSLDRKEVKEDTSLDNVSSDSELKLMYDKIVNRYRKHKTSASIDNERITVDETGDNDHSGFRVDPYSKQGSKYQELFRFCTQQPDVIVETCQKTSDLLQQNSGLNSSQMPLELETCFEKNADVKMPQDHAEIIPKTEKLKAYEKDNLTKENEAADVNVDKNKNVIEVPFVKNSISQTKAETFPRTSKKTTNSNYFSSDGGCEKAASYAGSLEHDRRSVYTETGSLDRYGDAKYHFLHEKGMIKICSPRLEIISKSPVSKRKQQTVSNVNNHISEEDTDTVNSSSDVSGIVIDNELHLTDYKRRLDELAGATESKQKLKSINSIAEPGQEITGNKANVMSSLNTELQARQDDLANDILENCLEMIDTNQAALDHVFDWINKDCNSNDDSLNEELESLTSGGNSAQCQTEDSVYYSFRGQSDEIRNILSKTELDQHELPIEDQSENQIDPLWALHDPNIDIPIAFHDDQKLISHDTAVINENQTEVSKVLESGNVISNPSLKEAIDEAIRQKNRPLVNQLLDHACGLLVDQDKNNVIEAWPAYQLEDEWVPIFVVLTVNEPESTWSEFLDFNVYNRKYSNVDTEAEYVLNSEIVRNNTLSFNDLETVKQVLDLATINSYNNATVVSISPCRSRKSGEEIHIETCIVFHCLVKGLIPFYDKPFPESIQGIPVDVREGYFIHGVYEVPFSNNQHDTDSSKDMSDIYESGSASDGSVRTSTEVGSGTDDNMSNDQDNNVHRAIANSATEEEEVEMDYYLGPGGDNPAIRTTQEDKNDGEKDIKCLPLQIGAALCGTTGSRIGTLGGFVTLPNGQIGFITCAHVVGTETGSVVSLVRDKNQQSKRFACGQVLKSVLCTENGGTGVDAAVVTVSDDMSIYAEWPSHTLEHLGDTGFDEETVPRSFNGRILTKDELPQYWNSNVVKLGCMTGLMRGKLYSPGTFVRRLPNKHTGESKVEFLGQLEIVPSNKSTKFFDLGDSGSLVFMVLNEAELYCIGLAVGCTSYGSCIVTPIEHVFKELMLPLEFYCPNREDN